MSLKDQILQYESEIEKYDSLILTCRRELKQLKLEKLRNDCLFQIETLLMDHLEQHDKRFQTLTNNNFDLLINDKIKFKVYSSAMKMYGSHSYELHGKIHKNGYLYLNAKKSSMNIMNSYPTSYIGFVNSFGETELKVNKQNYRFIASKIPKTYTGSINYQGEIIMQTDKTELEWTTDCYVNKVIADPFSGNNAKRNQFLLNMREMKAMIQEARKPAI